MALMKFCKKLFHTISQEQWLRYGAVKLSVKTCGDASLGVPLKHVNICDGQE